MSTFALRRRLAATALLVASAAVMTAAAVDRWWPACGFGGFAAPGCVERQDHRFDALPGAPWSPLGSAPELYAVALLLLAAAVVLLPPLLLGRRPSPALTLVGVGFAACLVPVAVGGWLSGRADAVVAVPGEALVNVWLVGWPLFLAASALWAAMDPQPGATWRLPLAVSGLLATPLVQAYVAPLALRYSSQHSTPWQELVMAVFLLVTAALLWPGQHSRDPGHSSPERSPTIEVAARQGWQAEPARMVRGSSTTAGPS